MDCHVSGWLRDCWRFEVYLLDCLKHQAQLEGKIDTVVTLSPQPIIVQYYTAVSASPVRYPPIYGMFPNTYMEWWRCCGKS